MKLLFDANVSRKIVPLVADLFPESSHVVLLGLQHEAADELVWSVAKERGYTIVTADADFLRLTERFGAPPKVIRLKRMDYDTGTAAGLIRRFAIAIAQFGANDKPTLILHRS